MEWIEVTGETVEAAEEHALKMLGIERVDAEFMVLEEPKSGIFRKKTSARLRARIKPKEIKKRTKTQKGRQSRKGRDKKSSPQKRETSKRKGENQNMQNSENSTSLPLMKPEAQEEILLNFFEGLFEIWEVSVEISFEWPQENICEMNLQGEDLEALVGSNGGTLKALEDIASVILKKQTDNNRYAQLRLDIDNFRLKRQEALVEFVLKLAEEVKDSGVPKILEPMDNRDRKIIHNALTDMEEIETVSEGENPKRRVKIFPTSE